VIKLLSLIAALIACNASAAIRAIYCDSQNALAGDGSLGNPFRSLASINWTTVQGWINSGDDVSVQLKRGSVFREALTVAASGAQSHPLRLIDFGNGDKPRVTGDSNYTGWVQYISGSGMTWQVAAPISVTHFWLGDQHLTKGQNSGNLADRTWFWISGQLYLRNDAGNPDIFGLPATGAVRPNALLFNSTAWLNVSNIAFTKTTSYAARTTAGRDVSFDDCEWKECDGQLYLDQSPRVTFRACRFDGSYGNQMALIQGSQTSSSFYFCLFANHYVSSAFNIISSTAITLVNCNFVSISGNSILNAGTGVVSLANCILTGHAVLTNTSGSEPIKSIGSSILMRNSLVLPNGYNTKHLSNVIELGRNLYQEPRYISTDREAVLCLATDDYENYDDWITFANLAKAKGFRSTLALSKTDILTGADKGKLQNMINQGHDIASHTRSHADLTTPFACYLRYVGTGTNCTVTVQGGHLTTTVSGGPGGENLDVDLNQSNRDKTEELVAYLDALPAYTCRIFTSYNHFVSSRLLLDVVGVEVSSAEVALAYDQGAFLTNELWLSKQDIESAFTAAAGGPYACRSLVYPGGYFNTGVASEALAAGYRGGRADETASLFCHMENLDLFHITVPGNQTYGYFLMLRFENNTLDTSPQVNNFTNSNVIYSTNAYRHSRAGDFNGTNAFVYRSANGDFNFAKGDWHFSGRFWTRTPVNAGTLFSVTNGPISARVIIDSQRAVNFTVFSNSAEILKISTPPASVTNGQYQKISVQQLFDRWFIRVNDVILASTTNTLRLPPALGQVSIGCAMNTVTGQSEDFYNGLMDDVIVSNGTYYKTQALPDMLCQFGGMMCTITHGESGMPREILRIFLDALADFTGNLKVMTFTDAIDYMRSRGVVSPDGRVLVRSDLGHHANYHLRRDSPCIGAGDRSAIQGIAGLHDLDGGLVTDSNGEMLDPRGLDIGAFVTGNSVAQPSLRAIVPAFGGGFAEFSLLGIVGQLYQVEASTDLANWVPFASFICSNVPHVFATSDSGSNRFFRAVVVGN
jgi:hypothetical protein